MHAPRRFSPRTGLLCLLFATLAAENLAHAQAPVDRHARRESSSSEAPEAKGSPFRGSTFSWNNVASAATLGIGQDYQSADPSYEMSFALAPRYYVWESEGELPESLSLGARLELIREFTNSDTTTEQGEWTFSNLGVASQYSHDFYDQDGYETTLSLRVPGLTFPTSKASANNGTILGVGGAVLGIQELPLLRDSVVFRSLGLTGRVAYEHVFRKTTTPTNPELERERMGPNGVTVPGDQLTGYAFTNHEVALGLTTNLEIHERVHWLTLFEWHLQWKYALPNDPTVELATGTAPVDSVEDPQTFSVLALFGTGFSVTVVKELDVELGYQNLTSQLGPDSQRRSMFYSPDARFFATLVVDLDSVYDRITGNRRSRSAGSPPLGGFD